jgi:hypothetical protein
MMRSTYPIAKFSLVDASNLHHPVQACIMQIPHLINLFHSEMTAWRQDLHAHPELGFEIGREKSYTNTSVFNSAIKSLRLGVPLR